MQRYCSAAKILLVVACCFSVRAGNLVASPLPPNVTASRSANGHFLLLTQREYDNPNPNVIRRIIRTTYQVLELEPFLNPKDRFSDTAVAFWSESAMSWQIIVEGDEEGQIFWPMISDGGNSLILVGVTAGVPGQVVLRINRKQIFTGHLVKSFQISDLWTRAELDPDGKNIFMVTDATPKWFAGGSLTFAADGRQLLYRTQWNDSLSIDLVSGAILR